jgi:general secretion pathway protein E
MDFARALRAILRQDPDIVMIGEIRDLETAQIAVQASLTGHLVLATLHTNDAASAVTRLIDMGIEPFLLSSSLLGVLGQRLVRKLCPKCKHPDPATSGYRAEGCAHCGFTGYLGRTGIYELLTVSDEMRLLVHQGANDTDIRRVAEKGGMVTMRGDAQRWITAGVTSQEEALRVTRE